MSLNYLEQRRMMKQGLKPTASQQKTADNAKSGRPAIPQKSAKKIAEEKELKRSPELKLNEFMEAMAACAPQTCMESGEPLVIKVNAFEVICHILAKRETGGVPSQAQNPINIVYVNVDIHNKMDKDLGPKSKGNYVRTMKIFPLLKERVKMMWNAIPEDERKSIPEFLRPIESHSEYIEFEEVKETKALTRLNNNDHG